MSTPSVDGTLYHLLPREPRGEQLLPLSSLRDEYPDLYQRHVRKYDGRMDAMNEPVPPLGCTWAEVVFLSPVHPRPIFEALRRSGRDVGVPQASVIRGAQLDPSNCVIRLMRHGLAGHYPDPADEDDFLPYTTASLRAVSRTTVEAIDRLENLLPGEPWLPWVDVPHILHRGPIPLDLFEREDGPDLD